MSYLTLLKAENFKRLVAVNLHFENGLVVIRGRNKQGKSSLLDAVTALILGKKHAPLRPIRDGADSAKLVGETDVFRITREWWRDGDKIKDKLTLEYKDTKARPPSPQSVLNAIFGEQQVDPARFLRMSAKEQADKMRELLGVNTSELDAERVTVFNQRTACNRDLATLKARFEALPEPEQVDEPGPEIDVKGLIADMETATAAKARNDACRREMLTLKSKLAETAADLKDALARVETLQATCAAIRGRITKGDEVCAALIDPDIAGIRTLADEASTHNARVRAQHERKKDAERKADEWASVKAQLEQAERTAKDHTARLEEIDAAKAKLLQDVKMPVPGLGLDGDMVTLNGIPLQQAAASEQRRTCLAIAAASSGELRTVLFHDGSLLDEEAQRDTAEWALENKVQVFMEVVGDGPGGIVIEDGQVATKEAIDINAG